MEPKICPYLGLIDDPKTSTAFPYEGNACYRAKKPIPVSLSYQQSHCLADAHIGCPGYLNGWEKGFPKELRSRIPLWKIILQNKWSWVGIGVLLLIAIWLIFPIQITSMGQNIYARVDALLNPTPTITATLIPSRTPTNTALPPTATATRTITGTFTPTSTRTNTPTSALTTTITETSTETLTPTATQYVRTFIYYPTDTQAPQPTKKPPEPTEPPPTQPPRPTNTQPPKPTNTQPPPPTNTPPPPPTNTPKPTDTSVPAPTPTLGEKD